MNETIPEGKFKAGYIPSPWEELGVDEYAEIEFVCWNEDFPYGPTIKQHEALYADLVKDNGLIPYRMDYRYVSPQQMSLSVIIFCKEEQWELVKKVEEMAEKHDVPIDLVNTVDYRRDVIPISNGDYPEMIEPKPPN